MKPTSIIFIILAAILIVCGIIACLVAGSMAKSQNIPLFVDETDAENNAVKNLSLAKYSLNDIDIDIKKAKVNIIKSEDSSYIELINFVSKEYDLDLTNQSLKLKDASLFNVLSFIKFKQTGIGFDGLRQYLALNKYKNKEKTINLYLTTQTLKKLDVKIGEGSITISNFSMEGDGNLTINKGDMNLNGLMGNNLTVNINEGNLTYDDNSISNSKVNVKTGNINCLVRTPHDFILSSEGGKIYIENQNVGSDYKGVYPELQDYLNSLGQSASPDQVKTPIHLPEISVLSFIGKAYAGDIYVKVK